LTRITTQPQDTTSTNGNVATLSVVATGGTVGYQWYRGLEGNACCLVGSTATIQLPPGPSSPYWVLVNGCGGPVHSTTAWVRLQLAAPASLRATAPAPPRSLRSPSRGMPCRVRPAI
jgi:hypothetical protein